MAAAIGDLQRLAVARGRIAAQAVVGADQRLTLPVHHRLHCRARIADRSAVAVHGVHDDNPLKPAARFDHAGAAVHGAATRSLDAGTVAVIVATPVFHALRLCRAEMGHQG
jgi:hypothetical protein